MRGPFYINKEGKLKVKNHGRKSPLSRLKRRLSERWNTLRPHVVQFVVTYAAVACALYTVFFILE